MMCTNLVLVQMQNIVLLEKEFDKLASTQIFNPKNKTLENKFWRLE